MTSAAETLLAEQLRQANIPFEAEFPFAKTLGRRWRADFFVKSAWMVRNSHGESVEIAAEQLLVEIDGGAYVAGRHTRGAGFAADMEKLNAAALLGYRVLRFTPAMVDDGRALAVIRQALGEVAA